MRKIQRIRGLATTPKTVAENALYTGHRGELVSIFDADGKVAEPFLMVHDGVTAGGWKYNDLQVPGGETEGTTDTGSQSGQSTQPANAQGIPAGWLTESVIDYSAYFDGNSYFSNRTTKDATNDNLFTISMWVKNPSQHLFGYNGNTVGEFAIGSSGDLYWYQEDSGTATYYLAPKTRFKDPSAWYHFVFVYDSANNTQDERMKMWVNGKQLTEFESYNKYPSNGAGSVFNKPNIVLGANGNLSNCFNGYMANVQFIDGVALDESYFGETVEGNWIHKPLPADQDYGTNGFYLNFADESNLGKDVSGNGNNWT
ncbi:MAG: hypothetical protein CMJ41_08630 [Phycisphaerae bacterium]|nr:hypothetical protein [Phycisphaerae bacterium]